MTHTLREYIESKALQMGLRLTEGMIVVVERAADDPFSAVKAILALMKEAKGE